MGPCSQQRQHRPIPKQRFCSVRLSMPDARHLDSMGHDSTIQQLGQNAGLSFCFIYQGAILVHLFEPQPYQSLNHRSTSFQASLSPSPPPPFFAAALHPHSFVRVVFSVSRFARHLILCPTPDGFSWKRKVDATLKVTLNGQARGAPPTRDRADRAAAGGREKCLRIPLDSLRKSSGGPWFCLHQFLFRSVGPR